MSRNPVQKFSERLWRYTPGASLVLMVLLLVACPGGNPTDDTPPDDSQTLETPPPVLEPSNGSPSFPGTKVDAFGMQTTPAEADDDPDGQFPFNAVTNPLNVFHDTTETFIPFLLVRDVDNPANPNSGATPEASASWTFHVSGFTEFALEVELAAKGDFEADDLYELTYQFDDTSEQIALSFEVDEAGVQTYTLFNIDATDTLFDPLIITDDSGPRTASNRFETYSTALTGTGDQLVLKLEVTQNGSAEMLALRNLIVKGTKVE